MINQTYRLISTKRTETVPGTLPEAIARAIAIETEYQPAFGVTVETILGRDTVAEIRDGVSDCEIPAAAQRLLDSIDTG